MFQLTISAVIRQYYKNMKGKIYNNEEYCKNIKGKSVIFFTIVETVIFIKF